MSRSTSRIPPRRRACADSRCRFRAGHHRAHLGQGDGHPGRRVARERDGAGGRTGSAGRQPRTPAGLRVRQPARRHLLRHRGDHRLQEGGEDRLQAGGRRPPDRRLRAGRRRDQRDGRGHGRRRDGEHRLRRDRARGRPRAGAEPGAQRPQLHAAGDADPRRAAPQRRRARHHDRARHQHLHQRQPRQRQPAHGGRRLQHGLRQQQQPDQQRRHRLHRGGQDQDLELLGGVRPQLRAPTSTWSRAAGATNSTAALYEYHRNEGLDANNYFNNARSVDQAAPELQRLRLDAGRPDPEEQALLLRRPGVEADPPLHHARRCGPCPRRAMRSGDFSGITHRHPRSRSPGQPFPGNVIPANRITPDGRAIANLYTQMEQTAQLLRRRGPPPTTRSSRATTRSTGART